MAAQDRTTSAEIRAIVNFDGYFASKDGIVLSGQQPKRIGVQSYCAEHNLSIPLVPLKPYVEKNGYFTVRLSRNGKKHRRSVHRLILETFVGPCPKGMECRHLDGNPSNNEIENLSWSTHITNIYDKFKHGTIAHGDRNGNSKLNDQDVREIRKLRNSGMTLLEISRKFGIAFSNVSQICRRVTWSHLGD